MTDRELLELAAKSAGYHWPLKWPYPSPIDVPADWNPLADDGDALRLAVKLRMHLTLDDYGAAARIGNVGNKWHGCETHIHGGIEPATRRAIVRAAAEIGKQK